MKPKTLWLCTVCLLAAAACSTSKSKASIQVTLQVMIDDVLVIHTDDILSRLEDILSRGGIRAELKWGSPGQFQVGGYRPEDEGRLRDILAEEYRDWNTVFQDGEAKVKLNSEVGRALRDQAMAQLMDVLRNRLEEFGVPAPYLERLPSDRILVEIPGVEDFERLKAVISTTARMEWKLVHAGPSPDEESLLQGFGGRIPGDMQVLRCAPRQTEDGLYLVHRVPVITGGYLRSVRATQDEYGQPAVGFSLNSEGAARLSRFTAENIGRQMAIVFDGQVLSAPVIQDRISDEGIIHGRFTKSEVEDLITVLKTGALPAGVKVLEVQGHGLKL